jgi:predicted aminopeptidase
MPRIFTALLIIILLISTSGCSTFSYYAQSIAGQMSLLSKRQSISNVIKNPDIQDSTRRQLEQVNEIREYASQYLHLPENNSYRDFADIGRDYVVWNVFATPEFSLQPREWCYFFVGCLSYRGYFSENNARSYAKRLELQGLDIFIGGVAAYSTLGWFDDPVLNTMLKWNKTRLARVIFHELAHQLIYIEDDTDFNEAFADTVAQEGVRHWLNFVTDIKTAEQFELELQREKQFVDLVFRYREKLNALYSSDSGEDAKRIQKNKLFVQMKEDYFQLRETWVTENAYDDWFESGLNNAKLSAVITYREYVPGFLALLNSVNNDLPKFYNAVSDLGKCSPKLRHQILGAQLTEYDC